MKLGLETSSGSCDTAMSQLLFGTQEYCMWMTQGTMQALPPSQSIGGSDLARSNSSGPSCRDQRSQSLPASSSTEAHPGDNSQPLMKFAETHRVMLNAFLRQTPTLLEESLSPLLRAPRLIDFDNKRLYFR